MWVCEEQGGVKKQKRRRRMKLVMCWLGGSFVVREVCVNGDRWEGVIILVNVLKDYK